MFWFNHYGLTTNTFSADIARTLSKRNGFSIRCCAKFVGHAWCLTVISHPERGEQISITSLNWEGGGNLKNLKRGWKYGAGAGLPKKRGLAFFLFNFLKVYNFLHLEISYHQLHKAANINWHQQSMSSAYCSWWLILFRPVNYV